MRPLEALLLAADLVAFVLVVVGARGRVGWLRLAGLLVLPAAGAQLLVEGPRWQMAPAYVLGGLLVLVWLRNLRPGGGSAGARPSRLAARAGAGLGVVALAVATALPLLVPVFSFPKPTGPAAIGTLTYHLVDSDRPEVFTGDPADRRELMVQVWYPAEPDSTAPRAPYVQEAAALEPTARMLGLPAFAFSHLERVTTNAIPAAPVARAQASYPVLLFSHGHGGYRQHNTLQVEELVSHGYVVAAIDHPYAASGVAFPDGRLAAFHPRMRDRDRAFIDRVIPFLAQDARFTLDQLATINEADPNSVLTGRLNLEQAGMFGVSLGGAVSAQACRMEPRLRACLVMDAFMPADVVHAGLRQPIMWLTRDAATMREEGWSEADVDEHQTTMRGVFERLPAAGYFVQVPGMFHLDFTDAPLLSPLASRLGLSGSIDPHRAHAITNAYSLAFFDRHLKGRPAAPLDGPAEDFPEARLETRRP